MKIWNPSDTTIEWRQEASSALYSVANSTWLPDYNGDAKAIAANTVGRIERIFHGSGKRTLKDCGLDCVISFERIKHSEVILRNPVREAIVSQIGYPKLVSFLINHQKLDAVPISCARLLDGKIIVWDGHHRLVSYASAKRELIPSFLATFRLGSGLVFLQE